MNIGIIGLGKLGLPMLSAFVKKGFNVKGYDVNASLVSNLRQRNISIKEDGLVGIMNNDSEWENRFTNSLEQLLNESNIIFVIVPTPSNEKGTFNNSYVDTLLKECNDLVYYKKTCNDIVITSTLNPSDCKKFQEKYKDLNIVYSPEFIALGTVLNDMLNPDICIIGSNNVESAQKVKSIYEKLYDTNPEYFLLGFTEAEIAKISINSFITMKVTFANIVGSLVYKTSGGNMKSVADTLKAIGSDSRINNKYLKFGTGYGGPCFPRDNRCLSKHLESNGINSSLQLTIDNLNNWMLKFFEESIDISTYKNIVYVGVSYKKGSDFLEESFIIKFHESTKRPDKNYYFVDEKVEQCQPLIKLTDVDSLNSDETLFLINYVDDITLVKLKDKNFFNFWANGVVK